jgi:thiaminase
MKKLLLSLVLTLIFISCNEKSAIEPIVNVEKEVGLKTNYDLTEVTITGYRDYTDYTSAFSGFYTLYIGNDYHVDSNPYKAFTEEYAGENINAIPGIIDVVLTSLNKEFSKRRMQGFNDTEMVLLRTLTVPQIFSIFTAVVEGIIMGDLARLLDFKGEPVDGGFSNAFVHVFMASSIAKSTNPDIATAFMKAHEANETGVNTHMDSNNNRVGINLIKNNTISTTAYYDYLVTMATNSQLWTIRDGVVGLYPYVPKPKRPNYQN